VAYTISTRLLTNSSTMAVIFTLHQSGSAPPLVEREKMNRDCP
jgi:hypothetical protein